jgi:ABC-2 type transport system permease protein
VNSVLRAAWVIARRDFVATVWARTYLLFLLAPLVIFAFSLGIGMTAGRQDRDANRPVVAVVADSATVAELQEARERLVAGTSRAAFPEFRAIAPAENVDAQARRLIEEEEQRLSAVLSGTIERPVVTGPDAIDEGGLGGRLALIVEEARRSAALAAAGLSPDRSPPQRVVTASAAGDVRTTRRGLGRGAQAVVFMITLLLATLLLSNMVEEKSNKVIEVLAAAVPLDAVFLGKLLAMLGASVVGLLVWAGMLGLGYFFVQALQSWMTLPQISPGVGWPLFLLLILVYFAANYMILGALFLGIGGQATNIREIQTISMPVTFLQMFVFFLALNAGAGEIDLWGWIAFVLPFSSPLSMIAFAAESGTLWPHLVALVWQAVWVVLIIRISSSLFRRTVLKSGARTGFWQELKAWGRG